MTSSSDALRLEAVTKHFGAKSIVNNLSLHVAPGEIVALLGASGSGKTTLLRLICGILKPDAGRVLIGGIDVTDTPPERRGLGYVFQDYALWPHLSTLENLLLVMHAEPKKAARDRAVELLRTVGLSGFEASRPERLSGGQRQRVALARALAVRPKLILLDEPYSALDPVLREGLRAEVARLIRSGGRSALHVTHDPDEAFAVADRLIVLGRGTVLDDGVPLTVYSAPRSLESARALGRLNELEVVIRAGIAQGAGFEWAVESRDGTATLAWRWEHSVIGAHGVPVTLERLAPLRGSRLGVWQCFGVRLIAPTGAEALGATASLSVAGQNLLVFHH